MYSQFAVIDPTVKQQFESAALGTTAGELRRMARELNATFGLCIERIMNISSSSPSIELTNADGLRCGRASVNLTHVGLGDTAYRYVLKLPTISKEKSSANSGRDERDSTSLASLIRAIKKNKEEPTDQRLYERLYEGANYPFQVVKNASYTRVAISVSDDLVMAMVRKTLGIDEVIMAGYISELQDAYVKYEMEMKSRSEAIDNGVRFAKGADVVCIVNQGGRVDHYIVGEMAMSDNGKMAFQGKLKRYATLADTHLAPVAMMVRTHMQIDGDMKDNEFGLPIRDKYYKDLDIATGYSQGTMLWVAIPKHAE